MPQAERISESAYKNVTATIVQNEILLSPQTVFFEELEELDFVVFVDFDEVFFVAIFSSSYCLYYTLLYLYCQCKNQKFSIFLQFYQPSSLNNLDILPTYNFELALDDDF